MKVVLASSSPRRAHLLQQIGLKFTIDPSSFDESRVNGTNPAKLVQDIARCKGNDVAPRHPESLIISADTIVTLNNTILGKPVNTKEAVFMLSELSGKTHEVFSGVCIALTDQNTDIENSISFYERTKVTFSALTDREIDLYVQTGRPFDKAGAYGIQDDLGSLFVEKIEGDYYNVVGFPLHAFYQKLKALIPSVHNRLFFEHS
ncbi:MAG: Maf family protein [Candidatus Paceibacterota bacterium]